MSGDMDGIHPAFTVRISVSVLLLILLQTFAEVQSLCDVPGIVTFPENNKIGDVVVSITTTQPGVIIAFRPPPENPNPFKLEGNQLIAAVVFDYEVQTDYTTNLICSKPGSTNMPLSITVLLINENDHGPVFDQTLYHVNVSEMSPVNTVVGRFPATDLDSPQLFYSLTPESSGFKLISTNTPEILVRTPLEYENVKQVELTLYAQDTAFEPPSIEASFNASTTIMVTIIDVDNRPPWFQPCTKYEIGGAMMCQSPGYTGKIFVNQKEPGILPLEPGPLYAIDGDSGINDEIIYSFLSGNEDGLFVINHNNGNITMQKAASVTKTIILMVMAAQRLNPYQLATTTVVISVQRKSLHPPRFQKTLYEGVVTGVGVKAVERKNKDQPLLIVATDDDYATTGGLNPHITYLVDGHSDFSIISNYLFMTKELPNAMLNLSVVAVDTSNEQSDTAQLSVEVSPGETTPHIPTTTASPSTTVNTDTTSSAESTTNSETTGPSTSTDSTISDSTITTTNTIDSTASTITPSPTRESTANTKTTAGTTKPSMSTESSVSTDTPGTTSDITTTADFTESTEGESTANTKTTAGTTKPSMSTESSVSTDTPGTTSDITTTADFTESTEGGVSTIIPSLTSEGSTSASTSPTGPPPTGPLSTPDSMTTSTGESTANTKTTAGTTKPSPSTESSVSTDTPGTTSDIITTADFTESTEEMVPSGGYGLADMAALGATLGVLLFVCLAVIVVLLLFLRRGKADWQKIYETSKFRSSLGQGSAGQKDVIQYTNDAFQKENDDDGDSIGGLQPQKAGGDSLQREFITKSSESPYVLHRDDISETGSDMSESHMEVKPSILTKERRVDEGYKSVWFKEDIDPNAKEEVLIIPDSMEHDSEEEQPSSSREEDEEDSLQRRTPRVVFNDADLDSGLGVKMDDQEDDSENDEALTVKL
ncbi:cadherin-related family member 5-like [Brachionichthys hirsutus]|uniref:cadherin-related family member 5-like n=1 Tax=Brachionichthys hirsutus TaxID=412623 RepID=UPI003604DCB5